ncbi:MAG: hypothetical protein LBG13_02380 [Holosporales bacterium]|jgi:hypothetical protein|nr:hypothetical protein [Holosporales bacterium]
MSEKKKVLIICLLNCGVAVASVSVGCLLTKRSCLRDVADIESKYSERTEKKLTEKIKGLQEELQTMQQQIAYFQKQLDFAKYKIPPIVQELEKLIENGEPFREFLDDHAEEIPFETGLSCMASEKIPTLQELQVDFDNLNIVSSPTAEKSESSGTSVWGKWQNFIKEKTIGKIKVNLGKWNEIFDKAGKFVKSGNLRESLECLEKIDHKKIDQARRDKLQKFLVKLKLRIALEEEFEKFKKQFANIANTES